MCCLSLLLSRISFWAFLGKILNFQHVKFAYLHSAKERDREREGEQHRQRVMIIAVRVKVLYAVHGLLPQASLYYSKSIFLDSTSEFAASGNLQVLCPFICATVPGSFKFLPTNGTLVDTHTHAHT